MEERHSGQNIATEISKITDEFKISDIICGCLHDNASNMDVAMKALSVPHFPCAGHTLQLAINDALKASDISKVVGRCRYVVSFFNKSVVASDALKSRQKAEGTGYSRPVGLLQDVSTRWNSTFIMLERLLRLRIPLYGVLHDRSIIKEKDAKALDLRDNDWTVAESLVEVLRPLQVATQAISGEFYPTLGQVYPIIFGLLRNHLKPREDDELPASVEKLRQTIVQSLERRFHIGNENTMILVATALHPAQKRLKMFSQENRDNVRKYLKDEIMKMKDENSQSVNIKVEQDDLGPSSPKKLRLSSQEGQESAMRYLLGDLYEISDDEATTDEVDD